ncbi:hypothetical protein PENSPDRAFT_595959 [Peniophora sp. CONT]|nr:hypothetical protein PENSPDRAFT_595959 [Peniophora sp. CONT]
MLIFSIIALAVLDNVSAYMESTVCGMPLVSQLCSNDAQLFAPAVPSGQPKWADFPNLMDVQMRVFDAALDGATANVAVSYQITKARMITTDLAILVRASDLPSREEIAELLDKFGRDARDSARHLQRFSAKIIGTTESILAHNSHALRVISRGDGQSTSPNSVYSVFAVTLSQRATHAFSGVMSVMDEYMKNLQLEGRQAAEKLNSLDATLYAMRSITATEGVASSEEMQVLLEKLWTRLGGNKAALRELERRLGLLANVNGWRSQANAYVAGTLLAVEQCLEEMEELRVRVATSALVEEIPLEVQAQSIEMGARRLRDMIANRNRKVDARLSSMETHDVNVL